MVAAVTLPTWYPVILIGIAAWRTFNLLAYDKILDQPRNWLLRLPRKWQDGDAIPKKYRLKWALFITCPYCAGFWISLGWFGASQINLYWTTIATIPFVLNTVVIALAKILTPED